MELTSDPEPRSITGTPIRADGTALTPEAFETLYREAWPSVVDYLRFRIGPAQAEDVAADVFVRAWAARGQYDPARGVPGAWLWGITRNAARAWRRDRTVSPAPLDEDLADDAALPEQGARAEMMARVATAMMELAPLDQEIVALRFGAGLSHRSVGEALGLTETAAAVRLHRAVRRLRIALEGSGDR